MDEDACSSVSGFKRVERITRRLSIGKVEAEKFESYSNICCGITACRSTKCVSEIKILLMRFTPTPKYSELKRTCVLLYEWLDC